ncbi:hypothetical protein IWZ01DRAFT_546143 [Phyllosticta capitalensis]
MFSIIIDWIKAFGKPVAVEPAPTPEKTALQSFHMVADSAAGLLDRIQDILYSAIAACDAMMPPGKFVIAFSLLVVILGGIWVYRGLRSRTYDTPDDSPAAPSDMIDWETKIRIAETLLAENNAKCDTIMGHRQLAEQGMRIVELERKLALQCKENADLKIKLAANGGA